MKSPAPHVLLALLASLLLSLTVRAAPLDGLENAVEEARKLWRSPGLAVAVVKDDEVVFMRGFGERVLGGRERVDERTLFTLASTSKAFVAVALGMLVDEGRLHWDDPVVRHLPEFRVADPYVTREITVRDVLAHRTGVEPVDWLWIRGLAPAESWPRLEHAGQAASLRETWIYNNMMYVVAGELVARVSGRPLAEFVQRRILEPLGMDDTVFTAALPERGNLAGATVFVDGEPVAVEVYRSESPLGAAGLHSNVEDMTAWIRFLLNEGRAGERQLLEPATFAELLAPQMIIREITYPAAEEADPHFFGYGLGWFLQDYRGRLLAMHTGSLFGTNALVAIVPEEELGLVILINGDPIEYRHAFMYDVIDRFLGVREVDWSTRLHAVYAQRDAERKAQEERERAARAEDSRPSLPRFGYTGRYDNPLIGEAEVLQRGRELVLRLAPDAEFALDHWSYDTFDGRSLDNPAFRLRLTFTIGADGVPTAFETEEGRRFERVRPAKGIPEND